MTFLLRLCLLDMDKSIWEAAVVDSVNVRREYAGLWMVGGCNGGGAGGW